MFIVPNEYFTIEAKADFFGGCNPPSVHCIIVPTILKLVADSSAYFEAKIGCDGHVAQVEQAMNITAQEDAVVRSMLAAICERLDMSRF